MTPCLETRRIGDPVTTDARILLIGGVGLVKGRVKLAGPVMREICDELEPSLQRVKFTENMPFRTISMIVRFGEQTRLTPEFEPLNRRHSDLPVSVELPMEELRGLKRPQLKERLLEATYQVLEATAEKYDLPYKELNDTLK